MTTPPDPPPGLIPVPMKGAVLLLTAEEFAAAVSRGMMWRRGRAMAGRDARPRRDRERQQQRGGGQP